MQQLLMNEMSADEVRKSRAFLASNCRAGAIDGLYWLMIPEALLEEAQAGHDACGPFAFAIEVGDDFVAFELLVRSESNLHCSCTCYATARQRNFLLTFMDRLVSEQGSRA